MKLKTFLLILCMLATCRLYAQHNVHASSNPPTLGSGAPSGNCTPGAFYIDIANQAQYFCGGDNAWHSSGGGTATALTGIANGSIAVGTATTLGIVTGFNMVATTGMAVPAATNSGAVSFTVTGGATGSPHIADFNLTGGSGGNGVFISSAGALQTASSITTGGATGAGAVGIFNADDTHFANLTADALNNLQINGIAPLVPWDKGGRVTYGIWVQCSGTAPGSMGPSSTIIGTSVVSAAVNATSSNLCLQSMQTKVSTPASGDAAGMSTSPLSIPFGHNAVWTGYIKIDSQASGSIRYWAGMTASFNTANGSDAPAEALAAFRYSTGASDTNFMCVTQADAAHASVVSSGVAADANTHYLKIIENTVTGHYIFYIDGAQKCDLSTGANLPAAGTLMGGGAVITTLTSAQRTSSLGYSWVEFDAY